MLDQTFSLIDIPRLLILTFLEGILSIDNALALALIVRPLPHAQKKKALFIGLISAIFLRALGILSAAYLIQLFWIQFLGSIYLIYLASSHLIVAKKKSKAKKAKKKQYSLWKIVALVELTDFAFAVDSILAGLALIGIHFTPPHFPPKIWIVYFGGIMGLILMRFAARLLAYLIKSFPGLELGAYLIVGWIGLKLLIEALLKATQVFDSRIPIWGEILFWIGIVTFVVLSFYYKKKLKSLPLEKQIKWKDP